MRVSYFNYICIKYLIMDKKCITCLPNGNIKQHEYAKFLKDNNINKIVYRLGEGRDWNFTTLESWNVLSKKLKKNKKLEWFSSLEYKG